MSKIIIIDNAYNNEYALSNVISYIHNSDNNVFSYGISTKGNSYLQDIESFLEVQRRWNKCNGKRVFHFIVSFDKKCEYLDSEIVLIALDIAEFFAIEKHHQVSFGVHIKNDQNQINRHIHYAINPINYLNGNRLRERREDFCEMADFLNKKYGIKLYLDFQYKEDCSK